jgi:hypothetical protein
VATSLKITEMSHFNENHVPGCLRINLPYYEHLLLLLYMA